MLPVVVCTGMILADLARPVTPEEYAQILQQRLRHEPLGPGVRAYYLAKGRVLACFLRKGMTDYQVGRILGMTGGGGFGNAHCWYQGYFPLGVWVEYRVDWIEVEGEEKPRWVVEKVEVFPP
jgi:hypothetical protein